MKSASASARPSSIMQRPPAPEDAPARPVGATEAARTLLLPFAHVGEAATEVTLMPESPPGSPLCVLSDAAARSAFWLPALDPPGEAGRDSFH